MHGILFDNTKCAGCGACMMACREQNNLPETDATDLTDKQFTVIRKAVARVSGKDTEVNYRRFCMHCQDPTCASVCPVGALHKTAAGPVVYNAEICLGCRYCIQACPFGVPKYEWTALAPRVRKCNFCADRLAQGKINACAEACPYGATIAGDRDALLKEARARLAAEPGKYLPKIYGEHDAGGTSVLILSSIPFAAMGLPENLPAEAMPLLTFRVLSKIPPLVAVGASVLTGLWWLTRRKEAVARAEGQGAVAPAEAWREAVARAEVWRECVARDGAWADGDGDARTGVLTEASAKRRARAQAGADVPARDSEREEEIPR